MLYASAVAGMERAVERCGNTALFDLQGHAMVKVFAVIVAACALVGVVSAAGEQHFTHCTCWVTRH